jgi:hypothetical protein
MHIFDIGQKVVISLDSYGDWFTGSEGTIEDIAINKNNDTIYGIRFSKRKNNLIYGCEDTLYYFLARELELAEGE